MRKTVKEIIETIKELKGFKRDSEVADLLGIGRGALSNAKQRNSLAFFNQVIEFCERDNHSLDIIRKNPFHSSEALQIMSPTGAKISGQYGNYLKVDVFPLASAVEPEKLKGIEPIDVVIVPREVYSDQSLIVQITGDSMEKLFMHGSSVVINTKHKDIVSGSIYAFKIPHEGNIVRECYSDPKGVSLIPYNKNYPLSRIEWEDFDHSMVIGKVACSVINVFR